MQASDVMTKDVIFVRPETSVHEIAELLLSKRISGVPVVNAEGRVEGWLPRYMQFPFKSYCKGRGGRLAEYARRTQGLIG